MGKNSVMVFLLALFLGGGYWYLSNNFDLPGEEDENGENGEDENGENRYTLNVDANLGGFIYVWINGEKEYGGTGSYSVKEGSNVVIEAQPFSGYQVISIEPDDNFVMDSGKNVQITFAEKEYL